MKGLITLCSFLLLSIYACSPDQADDKTTKETMKKVGQFDVVNMDTTISPRDDFYAYANGGWESKTEIPSDESRWGSFNELRESNDEMTLKLVDRSLNAEHVDLKSDQGKVVQFFNAAMDQQHRNTEGIAPIQGFLDAVEAIENRAEILDYHNSVSPFMGGLYGVYVRSDLKNSNYNALYLSGGALGLPERDYYLGEDEDSKSKRAKYVDFVSTMLGFIGYSQEDAQDAAERILEFETSMAESMMSKEERRNPENRYNPMTLDELNDLAPAVQWADYFDSLGAENFDKIIVVQPDYLAKANELLKSAELETLKDYHKWLVLNDAASHLSAEIDSVKFDFYGRTLQDLQEQKPLKERVLKLTNGVLGEALGKLYVAEYFPPEAKQQAEEMVENLKTAYERRINNLDWMSAETKKQAIHKLHSMTVKIGYPDKWKDYSEMEIGDSHYENILSARKWNFYDRIKRIGEKVDKEEWFISPQTVNAYYNPVFNEIVFPAGILQPPFFDYTADAALNYGGMGAVIGHEISHGFDDQGAKFDADGNMENWWVEEDLANFKERGDSLVAQYDRYEALPGIFVNGRYTLGENIGDLGGVNAAYDALQIHLDKTGRPGLIDGMTPEQRFFVNWATVWRTKFRDEALINRIKTDPHSPGQYRAIGPLVNIDAFYDAFDIQEGDQMYRPEEKRVKIW